MAVRLEELAIEESLKKIPGWGRHGQEIKKQFQCYNFQMALRFVNQIGKVAESMDHHPDILIHSYRLVTLSVTTHSAGGLTRLDFDLAQKIEREFQNLTTTP